MDPKSNHISLHHATIRQKRNVFTKIYGMNTSTLAEGRSQTGIGPFMSGLFSFCFPGLASRTQFAYPRCLRSSLQTWRDDLVHLRGANEALPGTAPSKENASGDSDPCRRWCQSVARTLVAPLKGSGRVRARARWVCEAGGEGGRLPSSQSKGKTEISAWRTVYLFRHSKEKRKKGKRQQTQFSIPFTVHFEISSFHPSYSLANISFPIRYFLSFTQRRRNSMPPSILSPRGHIPLRCQTKLSI